MKNNINNIVWFLGLLVVVGLLVFFPNQEKDPITFKDAMNQAFPAEQDYPKMIVVDGTGQGEKATEVKNPEVIAELLEIAGAMMLVPSVDLPSSDYRIELYLNETDYIGHMITISERRNLILIGGSAYNVVSDNLLLEELKKSLLN